MPTVIEELVIGLSYEVDQEELQRARREARQAAQAVSDAFNEAADEVEESFDDVAESADGAGKNVERSSEQSSSRFREVWTGALRRVGAGIVEFGAALPGRIADITTQFIDSSRELNMWSDTLNVSTDDLQRLQFVAQSTGTEFDAFTDGILTMQENLGELATLGTGPAEDSLGRLGLEIEDLAPLEPTQRLEALANALATVPTQAEQTSIALEIFGGAGERLLPIIREGSGQIRELSARADELGVVLDRSTIESANDAGQSLAELRAVFNGLVGVLVSEGTPALRDVAERLRDWIAENRELISQRLPELIDDIVGVTGDLVEVGGEVVEFIQDFGVGTSAAVVAVSALGIALGGLPGLAIAASAGLAAVLVELTGINDEVARLRDERETVETAVAAGQRVLETSGAELAELTPEQFNEFARRTEDELIAAGQSDLALRAGGILDARRRAGLALAERERSPFGTPEEQQQLQQLAIQSGAARTRSRRRRGFFRAQQEADDGGGGGGRPSTDSLDALFGVGDLPSVRVNELTQDRSPQVLVATINNIFTISQQFAIDGATRPELLPDQITDAFRTMFRDEVERTNRFVGSTFAR